MCVCGGGGGNDASVHFVDFVQHVDPWTPLPPPSNYTVRHNTPAKTATPPSPTPPFSLTPSSLNAHLEVVFSGPLRDGVGLVGAGADRDEVKVHGGGGGGGGGRPGGAVGCCGDVHVEALAGIGGVAGAHGVDAMAALDAVEEVEVVAEAVEVLDVLGAGPEAGLGDEVGGVERGEAGDYLAGCHSVGGSGGGGGWGEREWGTKHAPASLCVVSLSLSQRVPLAEQRRRQGESLSLSISTWGRH